MPKDEQQVIATKPQRDLIFNNLNYYPSEEQEKVHASNARIKLVAGGERAGKSKLSSMDLMGRLFFGKLFWLVAQDYERTKAEYTYICEALEKLGIEFNATRSVDPGEILIKGGFRVATKSAKDPRRLGMEAPDGIVVCEASQIDYETYLRLYGRIAEKRGWLLMSGTFESCLTADSLIFTDSGLIPISDVVAGNIISGLNGHAQVSKSWSVGKKKVVKATFDKNFSITATPDHKFITRKPDGSVVWEELGKLSSKDMVALSYGQNLWGKEEIEPDDAYLLGLYTAEGCMSNSDNRIVITNGDKEIHDFLLERGFTQKKDKIHFTKYKKEDRKWFTDFGVTPEQKALTKKVPNKILQGTRSTVKNYLQGLFDGDGSVTSRVVYYTSSETLAKQVRLLLLNFGVLATITRRNCKLNGKVFPSLCVNVCNPEDYVANIGFRLSRKQAKAESLKPPSFIRNQANAGSYFLNYKVAWCHLKTKEYDEDFVYDITVPDGHAFVANGFIVHNSIGWYTEGYERGKSPNDEGLVSFSLPTWSNLAIFPKGREDPEIKRLESAGSREWFMERFGGVPSPPKGVVFSEFRNQIHTGISDDYQFDPTKEVYLMIDPGFQSAYAVLAAHKKGDHLWVFDEIYERGLVTSDIIKVAKQKQWWGNVVGGAVDIAATQHQSMPAVTEVWVQEAGLALSSQRVKIHDGVERVKAFLTVNPITNSPLLHINSRCQGLISEMGGCPSPLDGQSRMYRWKTTKEGDIIGDVPEDKNNHSCKALAYGIVDLFGYTTMSRRAKTKFF